MPEGAADDLVHDALVDTLSRHPRFEGIAHPLGYAKTVLVRRAFRTRRPWTEVSLEVQERLGGLSTDDHAEQVEERIAVREALTHLGRRQRTCLVLRHVWGLDDEQIAAALAISPSTVRSQIARAGHRMRTLLTPEHEGGRS